MSEGLGGGVVMQGINPGIPASSNLEVVWRDNPDKIGHILLGNFYRQQNPVKTSCVEVVWQGNLETSAISYLENV
jgi:hypothetical protein